MPGSLSRDDAMAAAVGCKQILSEFHMTDVEIAFRESVFTRSAGPQLLDYPDFLALYATTSVRVPFTPAIGLHIAPRTTSQFEVEGTGGLYICEGGESNRVFVLTCRHVALPLTVYRNQLYAHDKTGQPRRQVVLLGTKAYQDAVESIMDKIASGHLNVDWNKQKLANLGEAREDEDAERARVRKRVEGELESAKQSIETLNEFHSEITKFWSVVSQRVLGHVFHSPPLSVGTGPKPFTEDWALIELHAEKINWNRFKGNVVDLGIFQSVSLRSASLTIMYRDQN